MLQADSYQQQAGNSNISYPATVNHGIGCINM